MHLFILPHRCFDATCFIFLHTTSTWHTTFTPIIILPYTVLSSTPTHSISHSLLYSFPRHYFLAYHSLSYHFLSLCFIFTLLSNHTVYYTVYHTTFSFLQCYLPLCITPLITLSHTPLPHYKPHDCPIPQNLPHYCFPHHSDVWWLYGVLTLWLQILESLRASLRRHPSQPQYLPA